MFAGKKAVITGASHGIGREIAVELSRQGAHVALAARSSDALRDTQRAIGTPRAEIFTVDVRSRDKIDQFREDVFRRFGEPEIVVNAAGTWHDGDQVFRGPLLPDTSVGQIDQVLETGLRGSFLVSRAFLPSMIHRQSGKILQVSCGFASPIEAIGWLHYYVTNKALEAFTQGLAAEVRKYQVQVNCIAPWFVATEDVERLFPNESKTAVTPAEVAKIAVLLVSSQFDNVSGQILEVRSHRDIG